MPYTFSVKEGDTLKKVEIQIDNSVNIFKTFRDMLSVVEDENKDDYNSLELCLFNNETDIHKNTYNLIVDLCNYLTDNQEKYLYSEKVVLDNDGNPVKDFNGNDKKVTVKDNKGWENYMNVPMCVDKNASDLPLSVDLKNLFAKYCDINNKDEYKYLYEGVLNVVNYTNCDNGVESDNESYVLHILCADYADSILGCRNF